MMVLVVVVMGGVMDNGCGGGCDVCVLIVIVVMDYGCGSGC